MVPFSVPVLVPVSCSVNKPYKSISNQDLFYIAEITFKFFSGRKEVMYRKLEIRHQMIDYVTFPNQVLNNF